MTHGVNLSCCFAQLNYFMGNVNKGLRAFDKKFKIKILF